MRGAKTAKRFRACNFGRPARNAPDGLLAWRIAEISDRWRHTDRTKFDLAGFKPVQFEFAPKAARINMRLSNDLLRAIKVKAAKQGVPYQRFIRQRLERAVASKKAS